MIVSTGGCSDCNGGIVSFETIIVIRLSEIYYRIKHLSQSLSSFKTSLIILYNAAGS